MTIQTRREFLGKLGWMLAGGILVPYVPKTFYSIPARPSQVKTLTQLEINRVIARAFDIPPSPFSHEYSTSYISIFMSPEEISLIYGTSEKQPLGVLSIGDLV